jgi:hypothetical protein
MSQGLMESQLERSLDTSSGYMEFDLESELGYQEWRGMFAELGVKACLFNAYCVQRDDSVRVSQTPVQLHLFNHAMYLSPPFATEEFYVQMTRSRLLQGKVYFAFPEHIPASLMKGYKPKREELSLVDIWLSQADGSQEIYSLVYEASIETSRGTYEISRFTV